MLSDLRESGSIEQDADIVMFLYRDEYYHPDSDRKNIGEVIIAKNRHGETGPDLSRVKNFAGNWNRLLITMRSSRTRPRPPMQ